MIIAFIGNDGSGKTTVIKLLQDKLNKSGFKTIYVPGYEHLFLDYFKKYLQGLTGKDMKCLQKEYSDTRRPKTQGIFYLWPYLVFLDCVCLFIKYLFRPRRIVLFDRYFYDYIISFQNLGISSWLEEFLFLLLPKPKHSFIFDVPAEIAYERKKDSHNGDLDYYEKQRLRYLWLSKKKNIPVINTGRISAEEVSQKILSNIKQKWT